MFEQYLDNQLVTFNLQTLVATFILHLVDSLQNLQPNQPFQKQFPDFKYWLLQKFLFLHLINSSQNFITQLTFPEIFPKSKDSTTTTLGFISPSSYDYQYKEEQDGAQHAKLLKAENNNFSCKRKKSCVLFVLKQVQIFLVAIRFLKLIVVPFRLFQCIIFLNFCLLEVCTQEHNRQLFSWGLVQQKQPRVRKYATCVWLKH
eukprot:TRINITY_DN717_c0_g1_i18.p1 TRINITY_DN717_c0_g1~~TRINITY_DN717_c0_g1_i18.p1  ORF type:complete len:202 (+),score=-1.19 TRINITY_DN717_c0_g1_i18:1291-1896(+)